MDSVEFNTPGANALDGLVDRIQAANFTTGLTRAGGRIVEIASGYWRIAGISKFVQLGHLVEISAHSGTERPMIAEVNRIEAKTVTAVPFDVTASPNLGALAWCAKPLAPAPHRGWKGRVLDALSRPIDGLGALPTGNSGSDPAPAIPAALDRQRVERPIVTGVKAIDIFTPLCAGQRIGVFAGSGVGKSTLLAMMARSPGFDCAVIALVGERGREVREFVEDVLGDSLERAVVVVSTSDESPMMRRQAPRTAMSIAEHFRDQGDQVLLIVDSLTRYAHAARDIAIASGEPPVSRGFPPTVFSMLPRLLERAGPGLAGKGSITAVLSVLVDGDDHNDPIADTVRGIVDGHIVLDRTIADQGRFPAFDPLRSISRLAQRVWTADQRVVVTELRSLISVYEESRDLRLMGGYRAGADARLDRALEVVPGVYQLLSQSPDAGDATDTWRALGALIEAKAAA